MFALDGMKISFKRLFSVTSTTAPKLSEFNLIKKIFSSLSTMGLLYQPLKTNKPGQTNKFLHQNLKQLLISAIINLSLTLKIVFVSLERKLYLFCLILIKT